MVKLGRYKVEVALVHPRTIDPLHWNAWTRNLYFHFSPVCFRNEHQNADFVFVPLIESDDLYRTENSWAAQVGSGRIYGLGRYVRIFPRQDRSKLIKGVPLYVDDHVDQIVEEVEDGMFCSSGKAIMVSLEVTFF